ncbi:hypothetical protein QO010_002875 [Caulobacter ginsengisoli]|uniref:Uncharacterized protein n=1 Tax=Caulobacter ginsengisoli TaxID=400775 RepID=A0ABU0IUT9_9CAUL|nr:hypothetical protein [Caulobacter ginsengisoli]MDQ0465091.1 hypothetical protein [Caulobacter ginsengisoli]
MEKAFVAKRVAKKLFATEKAVDAAMLEAAELMMEMVTSRRDLGLSAVVGDSAQAKLVEAIAALGSARTAMVEMHGELNDVRLRMGLRTTMGGLDDKLPDTPPKTGHHDLRQVG